MKQILISALVILSGCNDSSSSKTPSKFDENHAPVIESIPNLKLEAGTERFLTITASDRDGDVLSYALANNPDWAVIRGNVVTLTPPISELGTHSFDVEVSDGEKESKANVLVAINHAPVVESMTDLVAEAGTESSVMITASDSDGDILTYTLIGNPDWVFVTENVLTFTPSFDESGTHSFEIEVSDGVLGSKADLVVAINRAPKVDSIPTVMVAEGKTKSLTIGAYDEDGDVLSYSLLDQPEWVTIENNVLTVMPEKDHVGEHYFNINVSDGVSTSYAYVSLNVIELGEKIVQPLTTEPNFRSKEYTVLGKEIDVIEVDLYNVVPIGFNHKFGFNNISFFPMEDRVKIENKTPTPINKLIVKYGDDNIALLVLPFTLEAMHTGDLTVPEYMLNLGNIRSSYQTRTFTPNITSGIASTDDEDEAQNPDHVYCGGNNCYRPPFGSERVMMTSMAANLHNLMNSRDVHLLLREFLASSCSSYSECASYNSAGKMPYSDLMRNMNGLEQHTLELRLHARNSSGAHTAEGWGAGGKADVNNFYSFSSGWGSIKDSYVNPFSQAYRPYAGTLYDTLHHEAAHGFGLSHDSGMTYGFPTKLKKYMIEEGLSAPRDTDSNFGWWASERREFLVPDIYLDVEINDSFGATINVMKTNDEDIENLTIELLSHTPVKYTLTQIDIDTFFIQFDETFPDIAKGNESDSSSHGTTFSIIAYRTNADDAKVVTYKIDRRMLETQRVRTTQLTHSSVHEYFILEDDEFSAKNTPYQMRMNCFNLYGKLATPAQHKELYEELNRNELLSLLPHRSFVSSAQSGGYIVSDFYDEGFQDNRRIKYSSAIGAGIYGLCVVPRQQ